MTTAVALLSALSDGGEQAAWEHAKALAKGVLDDHRNVLAKEVLDGGPLAMRRAAELAVLVLGEQEDGASGSTDLALRAAISTRPV
jgi:hypothetical protein